MADKDAPASQPGASGAATSGNSKPPNPVWRMMGLPNFRMKLPSRNWMIFLTVVGSWTAAVTYDRREKKRIQKKWAKMVSHLAEEAMDTHQLPRKLTVYLSAPPADGIASAREHFQEYIKPILVAAALDWDAVEGRKEGDIRAGLAERIRRLRKKHGESSNEPVEEDTQLLLEVTRKGSGVQEWQGVPGDIVVGRHTWKEYVRGLHEGWLGPLDPPIESEEVTEQPSALAPTGQDTASPTQTSGTTTNDASRTATPEPPAPQEPENRPGDDSNKPKKRKQPLPFNRPADYDNAILSPNCPGALGPQAVIPFPHLLGFFNFPIRMYRFLNRRKVADDIGCQVAATVLATYRPYDAPGESHLNLDLLQTDEAEESAHNKWEQQRLLQHEEKEWHKSVRERKDDNQKERVWLDDIVLDPRIAERMRRFQLDIDAEEQARNIILEKGSPWWKSIWPAKKEKGAWEGLTGDE